MNGRAHARRIAALTVVGTAIVLPLVIFVLGPNMPPGNRTTGASSQVTDNTVLLVVMTPFTVFILVYLAYAIAAFRAPAGEELRDGPPIRGHTPSQIAWLVATSAAVLFLAIFGTAAALCIEWLWRRQRAEADREAQRTCAPYPGDRPAMGVHLPLSDLRWR